LDNKSVVSSGPSTVGCINHSVSPCFSLQLSVLDYNSSNHSYFANQWVFFIDHGAKIVGCATDAGNTGHLDCVSGNTCTFTADPSDDFVADTFYVTFSAASTYTMTVYNSGTGYSNCSPNIGGTIISPTLTGLVSYEDSSGVGYSNNACAVWSTGQSYGTSGYAPSGFTTGSYSTTPATCKTSGGTNYNGGSVIWQSGTINFSTDEAANLGVPSGTYTSASSFSYDV
jgi:hypothetical protein